VVTEADFQGNAKWRRYAPPQVGMKIRTSAPRLARRKFGVSLTFCGVRELIFKGSKVLPPPPKEQ
jgi:hypothetical protein